MSSLTPSPRRFDALLILLAAVVGAVALASVWNDSATIDEPAHIINGLLKLQHGAVEFYVSQPPLMDAVVALPVSLAGYRAPAGWEKAGNAPWVLGHHFLYRSGHDAHRILLLSRIAPIVLLMALVFAVHGFVLRVTQNRVSAFASAAMAGFCPVLLAHGRLATADFGAAYFVFVAASCFLALLRTPSTPIALLCGIATACAIASKTSAAILVPFFIVLVLIKRIPVRTLLIAAATSVAAFLAIYFAAGSTNPFGDWLTGVENIRQLYAKGYTRPQFLLGEFSATGWTHYYLVALVVKSTLPALIAFCVAVVMFIRRRGFELGACLFFAALFIAVAAFSSLNIGVRHILPAYPFMYAAFGIALAQISRVSAGAAIFAGWQTMTALLAFPGYLSYFNPLVGSARNADRVLIDSNLDWGQDLRRLGQWARENNVDTIRVHYFGVADIASELGPLGERWRAPSRSNPLPKGWFAVSRHFYRLSFHPRAPLNYDDYLRASRARYVTTIGGSIDVYRVE